MVEEPTESIVKELREMKIEEASEGDLNIDKSKPYSVPIAVIELPEDKEHEKAQETIEIIEIPDIVKEPIKPKMSTNVPKKVKNAVFLKLGLICIERLFYSIFS